MSLVTEGGLDWDHDHAILMVSEREEADKILNSLDCIHYSVQLL